MFAAIVDMGAGLAQWRTSWQLGLQDIELRYKRSLLGPFWISAALVVTVLAMAFVFSEVFRTEYITYVSFIAAGLVAWQLFSSMVTDGCGGVVEHAGMLQNVHLPLNVIAGRIVIRTAIVFAHNLVAVIGVLLVFGGEPTTTALLTLAGAAVILVFGYFLAMVLGPICARFRDIPLVIQSGLQVVFFLTPIFWMPSAVSHRPMFTVANPVYHMVELVRAPLLGHAPTPLNWQVSLWCCVGAALLAVLSISVTRKRLNLWL